MSLPSAVRSKKGSERVAVRRLGSLDRLLGGTSPNVLACEIPSLNETSLARRSADALGLQLEPVLSFGFGALESHSRDAVIDELIELALSWTFVQNPFCRLAEQFFARERAESWARSPAETEGMPFAEFVERIASRALGKEQTFFEPQTELGSFDAIRYDLVGRSETFVQDVDRIARWLRRPLARRIEPLPQLDPDRLRVLFEGNLVQRVADIYEADFQCFGYSFGLSDAGMAPAKSVDVELDVVAFHEIRLELEAMKLERRGESKKARLFRDATQHGTPSDHEPDETLMME